MKNVYKVVYDLKFGRNWLSGNNPNGYDSRHVVANGDCRTAAGKLEQELLRTSYGEFGKPAAVRILEITRVARDVLT